MSFQAFTATAGEQRFRCRPTREAILSWNATGPIAIDVRLTRVDGVRSGWLPLVSVNPWTSRSASDDVARIETDVLHADVPFVFVDIRLEREAEIFFAEPWPFENISPLARALTHVAIPMALSLPTKSQYIGDHRGWCSPASLSMLLGFWAQQSMQTQWDIDVATVAERIFDPGYDGTGNWTFATAVAGMLGLRGAVGYLRDLSHAQRFIAAGIPLAVAIGWHAGELPGAPLDESAGHVLCVRGFDANGDVLVHDPALPGIAGKYPRAAFEAVWLRHGGVAYAVAPKDRVDLITLFAEASV